MANNDEHNVKRRVSVEATEEVVLAEFLGLDLYKCTIARVIHRENGTIRFIIEGWNLPSIGEGDELPIRSIESLHSLIGNEAYARRKDKAHELLAEYEKENPEWLKD